jgi:hypothetical protein
MNDTNYIDPTTAPVAGKEPMLLLDVTGSMTWPASATSKTPRNIVIQEAISLVVERLAREDSEAGHEAGGGGLRTVTFANGRATDIEDLNPDNLRQKWDRIVWDGGTLIMPGWTKLLEVYAEEFGRRPSAQRPKLLALIITDGEARDYSLFSQCLQKLGGNIYVELAILGFGDEHDRAFKAYQAAADANPGHVEVRSFGSQTNPQEIAEGLLAMIA